MVKNLFFPKVTSVLSCHQTNNCALCFQIRTCKGLFGIEHKMPPYKQHESLLRISKGLKSMLEHQLNTDTPKYFNKHSGSFWSLKFNLHLTLENGLYCCLCSEEYTFYFAVTV